MPEGRGRLRRVRYRTLGGPRVRIREPVDGRAIVAVAYLVDRAVDGEDVVLVAPAVRDPVEGPGVRVC